MFPSGLVATYGLVRFRPEVEERIDPRHAIVAGTLAVLLVWGGLSLLDLVQVNFVRDLELVVGKLNAAILQGLTVVVVASTISVVTTLTLKKRGGLKP